MSISDERKRELKRRAESELNLCEASNWESADDCSEEIVSSIESEEELTPEESEIISEYASDWWMEWIEDNEEED